MIVHDEGETYRLVSQEDHARLAADIVALYREELWHDLARRDDVLFAVREHDNGWREIDRAPALDEATRGPCDFVRAPPETRTGIWRRGTRRHFAERPYSSLLITRHALALSAAFRGVPAWAEMFDELDAQQRALVATTDPSPPGLRADQALLTAADVMSIAVCKRWPGAFSCGALTGSVRDEELRLCPFPLREPATVTVAFRRIDRRAYDSAAELKEAFEAAPRLEAGIALLPAGP